MNIIMFVWYISHSIISLCSFSPSISVLYCSHFLQSLIIVSYTLRNSVSERPIRDVDIVMYFLVPNNYNILFSVAMNLLSIDCCANCLYNGRQLWKIYAI